MNRHEEGMKAAKAVAKWYIGDETWADRIVKAYLDPQSAMAELAAEKEHT